MRVIPGSQQFRDRYGNDIYRGITNRAETGWTDTSASWGVAGRDVPAVTLASQPGDVIVINYMTVHASFGGANRRRLLTAMFFPLLQEDGLDLLQRLIKRRGFTRANLFGEGTPIVHGAPSRRLSHLEQLMQQVPVPPRQPLNQLLGLFGQSGEAAPRHDAGLPQMSP